MGWKPLSWISLALLTAVAVISASKFLPSRPRYKNSNEAYFSRPSSIDNRAARHVAVKLNGVDWLTSVPEVRCGQDCELDITFPPRESEYDIRSLCIAPRRPEDGDDASKWIDLHCDWLTSHQGRVGDEDWVHPVTKNETVKLKAGEYVVRIYLRTLSMDLEQEKLPNNLLVAETKLRVLPPEDGSECGLVPLATEKQRMPAFVPD